MAGITSNRKLRFDIQGGPRTASLKKSHVDGAKQRRRVVPGYPWEGQFKTPEEVAAYFGDDRITCLMCGKRYKSVGAHLRVHSMTGGEYRKRFGLPWGRGLTCPSTKEIHRALGKKLYHSGGGFASMTDEERKVQRDRAHHARHRPQQPYHRVLTVRRGCRTPSLLGADCRVFHDEDYDRVLEFMVSGDKTLAEVLADHEEIPGPTAVYHEARTNAAFGRRLAEAWETISFAAQARGGHLGKRFFDECKRLRLAGVTTREIGRRLGVHWMSVERRLVGVVAVPEKTHCKRGHKKTRAPSGRLKCDICATNTSRALRGHLPRAVAAKVRVDVVCMACKGPTTTSRLNGSRPVLCPKCRRARTEAASKRWKVENRERSDEYQRAHYAQQQGDDGPMREYASKYSTGHAARHAPPV